MATIGAQPRVELDHQIARIGWALLFIVVGGLMLVPDVPRGTWLFGVGLILIGAQVARYLNGIPIRTISLVIGFFGLVLGVAVFTGVDLLFFPALLILIGISITLPARVGGEHA